jgi:NitT/TauT family transport system substrate-binding protein
VVKLSQSRRRLLATLSSAAGVSLVGRPNAFAQQAPLETTTIRIAKIPGICLAPQYVADELLRAEGFTDIRYVATDTGIPSALSLARGEVDFTANYAPSIIIPIDAGEPITIVGGEHIGCFESLRKKAFAESRISRARTSACKAWVQVNIRF